VSAFYNEIDDYSADWLENLIAAGEIPAGVVDRRSIEDIEPDELRDFTQCHFFAGIGVWPYALRRVGWPDDAPIWTGSCPCQPFSAAGAGGGVHDERHLWPHWHHLIGECRPSILFGEQVASKDGLHWLDLVQADLEGEAYASAAADLCAAGVGGAHLRQRLYYVGVADANEGERAARNDHLARWSNERAGAVCGASGLADALSEQREQGLQPVPRRSAERLGGGGVDGGLGHADDAGLQEHGRPGNLHIRQRDGEDTRRLGIDPSVPSDDAPGAVAPTRRRKPMDFLFCRDGKWRPVEPGSFPLAYPAPLSVGKVGAGLGELFAHAGFDSRDLAAAKRYRIGTLKGYGNALDAETATLFIESALEALCE
jgi:DNA (cytosine-5)-methyltransferase 1